MKNHYELLNLDKEASMRDIIVAYRKLAKIHHPDRGGSASIMIQLNIAYETLRDEEAREEYNKTLEKSSKATSDGNFEDSNHYKKEEKTYYWQTSSFNSTYSNDLVDGIWKELKEKSVSGRKYPYLFKKNLKKDIKAHLESLLSEFTIPAAEYRIMRDELFPLFAKAGYITARDINQQVSNIQDHWDKLEEILIKQRGFEGSISEKIENENHSAVEEVFPFEFNLIGKKFLEETLKTYENQYPSFNVNNIKLVIVLANLFIYGYTFIYSKTKIENERSKGNYGMYMFLTFIYIHECFPLTTKFSVIMFLLAIPNLFSRI